MFVRTHFDIMISQQLILSLTSISSYFRKNKSITFDNHRFYFLLLIISIWGVRILNKNLRRSRSLKLVEENAFGNFRQLDQTGVIFYCLLILLFFFFRDNMKAFGIIFLSKLKYGLIYTT